MDTLFNSDSDVVRKINLDAAIAGLGGGGVTQTSGIFTPTIKVGTSTEPYTYTSARGEWIKTGRSVTITIQFLGINGNGGAGTLMRVEGWPVGVNSKTSFTSINTSQNIHASIEGTTSAALTNIYGAMFGDRIWLTPQNGVDNQILSGINFGGSGELTLTGTYITE
jgi:hypothetical protein